MRQTVRLTTLATLGAGAAVLVVSPLLFAMFGPGFEHGVTLLAILIAGVCVQAAFGPAEDVLTMLGAERLCAGISLAALGLAAALNLALIPLLGPAGAALAMATAGALRALGLALAARRRLGLSTHVLAGGA